jgi:PD-(D/E)XK nuclease superfamily
MKKIYASSSAFAWGELVFTDSKAGCVRSIMLQANGVFEGEIDPKHVVRGALNEEEYEKHLKSTGQKYTREHPIRAQVPGYSNVIVSGRVDFIRHTDSGDIIDELKSTESTSVLREVITKGKPKVTHLAQVTAYMIMAKAASANLICTYYENDEGVYTKDKERLFEILIDDAGRICVDSVPSGYSVSDLYTHQKLAAKMISEHKVGQRPKDHDAKWGSPCGFCVWKGACDAYDSGAIESTTDSFVSYAKQFSKEKKQ